MSTLITYTENEIKDHFKVISRKYNLSGQEYNVFYSFIVRREFEHLDNFKAIAFVDN